MTATQSAALKHWSRVLRRWPVDRVRPENVSFQRIMKQRIEKRISGPSPNAAATGIKTNEAMVSAVPPLRWEEAKEMEQANVLYSLLENRYAKRYHLQDHLRRPASSPDYYDNLLREMQEAPDRSWFGGLIKRVKGSLRFS